MAAGREENRQIAVLRRQSRPVAHQRTRRLSDADKLRRLLELHRQRLVRTVGFDVRWNTIRKPDRDGRLPINCTNQVKANLYSFHPGACGILMCDGSAHMVSENLSIITLCRLITFKGHSPVTDSF